MTQDYAQRIANLTKRIALYGEPKNEGQKQELRQLVTQLRVLEAFKMSDELGPIKHNMNPKLSTNKNAAITKPDRRIYEHNVAMTEYDKLFVAPPFGHFGVFIPSHGRPIPELGDFLEFKQYGKVIVKGVVVAVEPPGQSIRPDISGKALEQWKIHWVPWEPHDYYKQTRPPSGGRKQPVLLRQKELRPGSKTGLPKVSRRGKSGKRTR